MITVNVHGAEFRLLKDFTLQSKLPEDKDFKQRPHGDINFTDGEYAVIIDTIAKLNVVFGGKIVPLPKAEAEPETTTKNVREAM